MIKLGSWRRFSAKIFKALCVHGAMIVEVKIGDSCEED